MIYLFVHLLFSMPLYAFGSLFTFLSFSLPHLLFILFSEINKLLDLSLNNICSIYVYYILLILDITFLSASDLYFFYKMKKQTDLPNLPTLEYKWSYYFMIITFNRQIVKKYYFYNYFWWILNYINLAPSKCMYNLNLNCINILKQ